MTTSVHAMKLQIERVVRRDLRHPDAEFFHLREGGRWLAASAWFTDRGPKVASRSGGMTLEEAFVVQTAISMAIDWAVEESKLTLSPVGDLKSPANVESQRKDTSCR